MREFLEDAFQHRDDGYGRAQKHAKQELPKRFYKETGVVPVEGGFTVTLDGRPTRTPGRVPVVVPVAGIATIMAEEWAAQGERIDAQTMPMVRLVNSALESGEGMVPSFRDEVVKFAGSDLMLYRAESPRELAAEQEAMWDEALVKLARHFGVSFQPTIGILHQPQPPATLAKLEESLEGEGLLVLTALVSITGLTGSGLLAIGLLNRLFTPDYVWSAAHVDEDFQIRQWGEDEEAIERRARRRIEFDTAVKLIELMRG
ncbi:ATP12 family chaperone protein [Paradevosia shaoguanensis]|uniref:ATPase n=1 Tax=Paradevosia shaoguanensis TaxID=1335043 RepID=A0AA41QNH9_9HYPH|nr:ATP12 family protein [Paradevosia shaoguanensis]MCF1742930.1 ATPase [Paradevosia shaoguanensis]MCI0127413.1 ATPase [Paradevosia shaoguanensis]